MLEPDLGNDGYGQECSRDLAPTSTTITRIGGGPKTLGPRQRFEPPPNRQVFHHHQHQHHETFALRLIAAYE
jgi:hypothetical protein